MTEPTPRDFADLQRPRLLVVEDHEHMARMMQQLLESEGFEVATTGTLHDAIELAHTRPFDLVLSDLTLPDGHGDELPQRLRDVGPPPSVALSGYGAPEDIQRSRAAGFAEHLVKPVDADQLVATLRRVLAEARQRAEAPPGD